MFSTFTTLTSSSSISQPSTSNEVSDKYIAIKEIVLDESFQKETFVLTKGNQYLIGTNSNDIFIYLYKQTNTITKKNMKKKFIENGKAIIFECKEDEVYHLHFRIVSSMDKKNPYKATIYYVKPSEPIEK